MKSQVVPPERDLPELPYFTLDLHESSDADEVEVLLTGDLDRRTVGHLDDGLAWVVEHMTQRRVVVDVAGLARITQPGSDVLERARRDLAAAGRTFDVRGAPP